MEGLLEPHESCESIAAAKYMSCVSFWDGIIHAREMKGSMAKKTAGYIYAAHSSSIPNVIKIGVCWDFNLNIRQLEDENHKNQVVKSGEKMVTERLEWLSSQANLPEKFEIIAGFATRNPYKTKWQLHNHFSSLRVAHNMWYEFFKVERCNVCNTFAVIVDKGSLPSFPEKQVGGGRTDMRIISQTQPQRSLGAWDSPLIPKLITPASANANSSQDNSSHDSANVNQDSGNLDQDSGNLAENLGQDSDSLSQDSGNSSQEEDLIVYKQKRSHNRCKRLRMARDKLWEKDENAQPGLFIAEMNCGLHISLGPCLATKHYDSLHQDAAHPLIVIHMVVPSRGKPYL